MFVSASCVLCGCRTYFGSQRIALTFLDVVIFYTLIPVVENMAVCVCVNTACVASSVC